MTKVAKLLIIDDKNNYLLMYRDNHPTFGNDPDLPGGMVEDGESVLEGMVREVEEETGIIIDGSTSSEIYSGSDYSAHGTHYSLFVSKLDKRPQIAMSWEHASYEWLERDNFLEKAKSANDVYMHMVYDVVQASV